MTEDIKKTGDDKVLDSFTVNEEELHIMPNKFVIQNPKKKDSGAKGIIVFFVIFFVLLMLGLVGGYYFIQQKNKPKNTNNNQNVNQNTNQNTNVEVNTNTNVNENINSNQNTNENTNNNENINTNTNTNINITPPPATFDTDLDGLTDLEEQLYQSDPKIADSDKDGYKDGDEVKNLYSPLASIQKLIESGLVIRYTNDLYRYEIFSPKGWLVKAIDDSRQKIEFIPDNSTSELVHLEVSENTTKKSLLDWQKALYGDEAMENFKLGQQSALRSMDKKKVLVVSSDYVYTILYDVSSGEANFSTTFDMMLASFAFVNPAP